MLRAASLSWVAPLLVGLASHGAAQDTTSPNAASVLCEALDGGCSTLVTSTTPSITPSATTPSSATIIGSGPVTTSCPPADPEASEVARFCVPYSNPDEGISNVCMCDDGGYYSADSPCDMCPWTTTPPESMTLQTATTTADGPDFTVPANPNCAEGKIANADCWDSIGAVVALQQFWDSEEEGCRANGYEDFANCWYSLKMSQDIGDCGKISSETGCSEPSWDDFAESENAVIDYYVTYAIWNSNKFFTDLWFAIGAGAESAESQIGVLVDELVPADSTSPWKYVLFAMSFALSLYAEGPARTKAMIRTPGLSSTLINNVLFPPSTQAIEDTITTWAQTDSKLGLLADAWKAAVAETSTTLFADVGTFLEWCNNDFWCTGEAADLQGLSASMKLSLGTYVASEAIKAQGLVVSRAAGLDVADLQATSGDDLHWDTGCTGYDEYGTCGSYVFDGTDTYSIVQKDNFGKDTAEILQMLFSGETPMTTPELLFTGSYACSQTCDATSEDCAPSIVGDAENMTPVCLSSMNVCTWNWDDTVPWVESESCPNDMFDYRWCASRCQAFQDNGCTVPETYLGGGIMNNWDDGSPWADKNTCNKFPGEE